MGEHTFVYSYILFKIKKRRRVQQLLLLRIHLLNSVAWLLETIVFCSTAELYYRYFDIAERPLSVLWDSYYYFMDHLQMKTANNQDGDWAYMHYAFDPGAKVVNIPFHPVHFSGYRKYGWGLFTFTFSLLTPSVIVDSSVFLPIKFACTVRPSTTTLAQTVEISNPAVYLDDWEN